MSRTISPHDTDHTNLFTKTDADYVNDTIWQPLAVSKGEYQWFTSQKVPRIPLVYRGWHAVAWFLCFRCCQRPLDPAKDSCRSVVTGLPIVPPTNRLLRFWSSCVALYDGIYVAFLFPVFAAYLSTLWHPWYFLVSGVSGIIFVVDLFVRFNAGIQIRWMNRTAEVLNGRKVAHAYIWRGTFFIDALSSLPIIAVALVVPLGIHISVAAVAQVLHLFRLFRLMKMPQLLRRMALFPSSHTASAEKRRLLRIVGNRVSFALVVLYFTFFVINLLGCLWFAASYVDPSSAWVLDVKGKDLTDGPFIDQWVASMYFTTMTVTTIGYGDVVATNTFEMFVSILIMLIGVIIFGAVLNLLGQVLFMQPTRQQRLDIAHSRQLEALDEYMHFYTIPLPLQAKVKRCLLNEHVQSSFAQDVDVMFGLLPPALRWEFALYLMDDLVHDARVWPPAAVAVQPLLLSYAELSNIGAWWDLWLPQSPAEHVMLLQEGTVDLFVGSKRVGCVSAPAWLGNPAITPSVGSSVTTMTQPHLLNCCCHDAAATALHLSCPFSAASDDVPTADCPSQKLHGAASCGNLVHGAVDGGHHQKGDVGTVLGRESSLDGDLLDAKDATSNGSSSASYHSSKQAINQQLQQRRQEGSIVGCRATIALGHRVCLARAQRACRVWKLPLWTVSTAVNERPSLAGQLTQCMREALTQQDIARHSALKNDMGTNASDCRHIKLQDMA